MTISRQLKWQKNKKKEGKCSRCGAIRDGKNKQFCIKCALKVREYQRKRLGSVRRNLGCKSYKKENSDE